ncbi:MAG: hypothetical protein HY695_28080 [Deltaproteobacteria bacterium]|nr:hypothetical protein [Deltaproteobacteria bacterium]
MPEQISKYPEVTLEVLKGAGAVCGQGAQQKILKKCPADRFCSLPTGEICVYGIKQIPQMTQITRQELAQVVCPKGEKAAVISPALAGVDGLMLGALFLAGLAVGTTWQKLRTGAPRPHVNADGQREKREGE